MGFAATAKYPAAIAQVGDLLNQANKSASAPEPVLGAALSSTSITATLKTGTGVNLPTDNFVVMIDQELIFVTSRSGDTLNSMVRGYESTGPQAHSSGANVDAFMTALSHNQLAAEINAIEVALGTNLANLILASTLAQPNGVATLDGTGHVQAAQLTNVVATSSVGQPNGVASLDATGKVPSAQLPSSGGGGVSTSTANSWTAKQTFNEDGSGHAGLNLAPGAVPSSPAAGDVYIDSTSYMLRWYANSSWFTAEAQQNKNVASGYAGLDGSALVPLALMNPAVVLTTLADAANGYVGTDGSGHADEAPSPYYPKAIITTPVVANAATIGQQNLMQWTVPAGYMDNLTRVIEVEAWGTVVVGANPADFGIKLVFIAVASLVFATIALNATQSASWYLRAQIIRNTAGSTGTTSAGGLISIGNASFPVSQLNLSIDETVSRTMAMSCSFDTADSSNVCTQAFMSIVRTNW